MDNVVFKFSTSVTPNNSTDNILDKQTVPQACRSRGISCAVAGVIAYLDGQGKATSFTAVAGVIHRISTKRILSTSTTATGIEAHW